MRLNLTECTFTSNFLQGSIFYLYELTNLLFRLKSPSFLQFQQICGFVGFSKMMPYVGLFDFVASHENLRQSEHIVHEKKA